VRLSRLSAAFTIETFDSSRLTRVHEVAADPLLARALLRVSTMRSPAASAGQDVATTASRDDLIHALGRALANAPTRSDGVDVGSMTELVYDVLFDEVAATTTVRTSSPEEPVEIKANPSAFALALLHVVLNAIEAANAVPSGEVRIAVRRAFDGGVQVDVSDNGPGMDGRALDRAFDPFFSKNKEGSRGMGLPLARALLHSLGGSIQLESAPSLGTVAKIAFGPAAVVR
jgi:signal transduction histidine kinase